MKRKIFLLVVVLIIIYCTINVLADTVTGLLNGHYFDSTISTQSNCTVESGSVAVLEASSGIIMAPGFCAKKGGRYYAIAGHNHDGDSDSLPDWFELLYFELFSLWSGNQNADDDSLTNLQEYNAGTDPTNDDTDYDLMPDDYEVANGLDPVNDDADGFLDSDPYSNYAEYVIGTDPNDGEEMPVEGCHYRYDPRGRVVKTIYLPDTEINYIIEYNYDEAGNGISRILSSP